MNMYFCILSHSSKVKTEMGQVAEIRLHGRQEHIHSSFIISILALGLYFCGQTFRFIGYLQHIQLVSCVKFSFQTGGMIWEQELYNQFKYRTPRSFFHTFDTDVSIKNRMFSELLWRTCLFYAHCKFVSGDHMASHSLVNSFPPSAAYIHVCDSDQHWFR